MTLLPRTAKLRPAGIDDIKAVEPCQGSGQRGIFGREPEFIGIGHHQPLKTTPDPLAPKRLAVVKALSMRLGPLQQGDPVAIGRVLDPRHRVIGAAIVDDEQMIGPLPDVMVNPFIHIQPLVLHDSQHGQCGPAVGEHPPPHMPRAAPQPAGQWFEASYESHLPLSFMRTGPCGPAIEPATLGSKNQAPNANRPPFVRGAVRWISRVDQPNMSLVIPAYQPRLSSYVC